MSNDKNKNTDGMNSNNSKATYDTIIIGAGIAGLTAALELAKADKQVLILDAQDETKVGGLARSAFGGMALIGTPEQKRSNIIDSPAIALKDWHDFAHFSQDDIFPKQWAKLYVESSYQDIYHYVKDLGVKFLPAVNWVERGLYSGGNSVPRYHVIWGTSLELVNKMLLAIAPFKNKNIHFNFNCKVNKLIKSDEAVIGCQDTNSNLYFADNTIVASGGFTGNLAKVKEHWPKHFAPAPENLLNGTHPSCDGAMHDEVNSIGGNLTHLDKMWNYAAGIPHPKATFNQQGLSLIPCKSALWLDSNGKRIGPAPMVTGFDTHELCRRMSEQKDGYAWQVLNWKIASKEFAVSGAEHNPMIRDKKLFTMLKETLLGNHRLVKQMQEECDHFIVANTVSELTNKMNALTQKKRVNNEVLQQTLDDYDAILSRPSSQWNDDQIRRIEHARKWKADKLRTCKPHPIQDEKHGPLIAIKVALISRKSLGGIQTNLNSQVVNQHAQPITGLYAIGEASGFGGGGSNGEKSLEGTFLAGCILTAQQAAKNINNLTSINTQGTK
ncbi:FAD-dependent oxidoreductase [Colwellia sp. 1_MG-2023]|uniref:FAD-dependent oxidoreductase n=1 Tax=unclassified Colwellia TaxID=196834 RepID=UPI002091062E|nr:MULTISPECIES: FAD-dependent oxidoreductase [unclassified Colwellia]MDO6650854.1 FAD-dependent oxidoreductase [Colwellia sp. 3_MG-2023]MDO6663889.1 FAD-dependent oxidoreductase [Colwellia sp. 2_MG-2023]MDO6688240.1 FAD-dependent oxidoreductase [Colwellia sp. 1_MG-2023]